MISLDTLEWREYDRALWPAYAIVATRTKHLLIVRHIDGGYHLALSSAPIEKLPLSAKQWEAIKEFTDYE